MENVECLIGQGHLFYSVKKFLIIFAAVPVQSLISYCSSSPTHIHHPYLLGWWSVSPLLALDSFMFVKLH